MPSVVKVIIIFLAQ